MKKFTLLIALLLCFVAFGQERVGTPSIEYPTKAKKSPVKKQATNQVSLPYQSLTSVPAEVYAGMAARSAGANAKKTVSVSSKVAVNKLEDQSPKMQAVVNKYNNLGSQTGNVSDYFSMEEAQMLRAYFGSRKIITDVSNVEPNLAFTNLDGRSGSPIFNGPAGTSTAKTNSGNNRMPVTITHSVSQTITPGDGITCNNGTALNNSFFRDFDLDDDFGVTTDFEVTSAEFGVETISGNFDVTVNIWSLVGAFPGGVLTLQNSVTQTLTPAAAGTIVSIPIAATIPFGDNLVYEISIEGDGVTSFFLGCNTLGQTGPSWILAPDCGAVVPTDLLAAFGLPNSFVMNIVGDEAGGGGGGGIPTAYGYESQTITFGSFESAAPAVYTQIANSPNDPNGDFEGAGAIDPNGDGTTGYAITSSTNTLYSIDLATGVYTSLGNVTAPGGGSWVGMEFDPSTGTLYGLSGVFGTNVSLSVIDLGTVTGTLVGTDNGSTAAVTFAIDASGVGYLTDVVDDSLWAVDLATGAHTLVGSTGIDLNFGQGMTYDVNSDQLFTAAFNAVAFTAEWRSVDTATGATTLVGAINVPDLTQMAWVGMPDAGGGGGGGGCATGVYTDRASFDAEAGALPVEDLAGGPGFLSQCGLVISEAGDSCFPAGEILPGIEITSNNSAGDQTVYVDPADGFGNTIPVVGSNAFLDYTIINFPNNDVNSFGFDLVTLLGTGPVEVRIFGVGGLIDTQSVNGTNPESFWGYIASETIVSVELEDLSGANVELIGNIAFGECAGGGGGGGGCGDFTYENVSPTGNGVPSQIFPDFPDFDSEAVDDVVLPGPDAGELCSLDITGSGAGLPIDPNNTVVLTVYTDNGGVPGSVAFTETFPGSVDADGDGSFTLEPTGAPVLNPNTTYWVSVVAVMEFGVSGQWFWSSADDGNDAAALWQNPGGGFGLCPTWGTFADCTVGGGLGPDLLMSAEFVAVELVTFDDCEGALPISCGDSLLGSSIGATPDNAPDCDTSTQPGVWYKFVDDSGLASNYVLTTCSPNTDYDTKVSVYSGDCNNLVCVAGNDDDPNCPNFQTTVEFSGDGATTYYILVHGFAGATGNFELSLTCECVAPPNDDIADAINLIDVGCPFTDEAVAMPCATLEDGTPSGCDISGANGVWYVFTPELDGFITGTIGTPGDAPGTNLSVNNGPLAGNYSPVAASFGGAIPFTPLTQDAVVVIDDDTTGDPNDACDPIINGGDLNGKFAILKRGSCEFGLKALAAQNEGAVAVVVVNNQPGDPIVMGGGEFGDQVTIPVVMISDVEGNPIIAEILGGNTVNMTLSSDFPGVSSVTFYTAPDESSTEDELVWVDWWQNQCLPSETATIPVVAGQTYYCFVVNSGAVTDIIFDNCQLGVDSNEIEGFAFYPNPTNDIVNLSSVENIEKVALYNILGQKLMDLNVNATTTELNVSNLAAGAYLMEVTVDGQKGTYKVIKR